MPVSVNIANHPARSWWDKRKVASSNELLQRSCNEEYTRSKRIIQSSVPPELFEESHIASSNNGFVYAAYHAYSNHHHLTIRPDDIWFAILSQLNFYINAHAEELRSHFVDHKGQKELVIKDVGTIDNYDFAVFARRMTGLIQENVKDPDFRDWIMPAFTTTTVTDRTTAAILMMGSMQAYFTYTCMLTCGIPSVTLLGDVSDYEDILARLDKLEELGSETTAFADLLRPILRNFIATFDPSQAEQTRDFWSKIAHFDGGSGPSYLSGWLTAFCFWRNDGKSLYFQRFRDTTSAKVTLPPTPKLDLNANHLFNPFSSGARTWPWEGVLVIDGVRYAKVEMSDIPNGFAAVPVKVLDNGTEYHTRMVAGSMGMQIWSSEEKSEGGEGEEKVELDSVRSLSGWLMYELKESEVKKLKV